MNSVCLDSTKLIIKLRLLKTNFIHMSLHLLSFILSKLKSLVNLWFASGAIHINLFLNYVRSQCNESWIGHNMKKICIIYFVSLFQILMRLIVENMLAGDAVNQLKRN